MMTFAIPTYRLRDVGETVEAYDRSFWRNGKVAPIVVFDDTSKATHHKHYPLLERTSTHNDVYYVGPAEKAEFVRRLIDRLGDRRLESIVKNRFRPSYGGNRNFTLMYTLGGFPVSSDDDMRPSALIENSVESLGADEISRGKLVKATGDGFTRRSYDVLRAFDDVLGRAPVVVGGDAATHPPVAVGHGRAEVHEHVDVVQLVEGRGRFVLLVKVANHHLGAGSS